MVEAEYITVFVPKTGNPKLGVFEKYEPKPDCYGGWGLIFGKNEQEFLLFATVLDFNNYLNGVLADEGLQVLRGYWGVAHDVSLKLMTEIARINSKSVADRTYLTGEYSVDSPKNFVSDLDALLLGAKK